MQSDDLLYLGHMLDMARKAYLRVIDLNEDEYDTDEGLRYPGARSSGCVIGLYTITWA